MSTREQILAIDDVQVVPVAVPEWGMTVHVRSMTAGDRDRFEASMQGKALNDIRAKLAVATVCDADGTRVFNPDDVAALSAKSAAALSRLFNAAAQLNHLLPGDVEALEKNSVPGPAA